MAEQFANNAATTLTSSLNAVVTSVPVFSAVNFPTSAQYRIIIGNEIMIVTAGAGTTTWTVTRGAESTTAATHNNGASVLHTITAGALSALAQAGGVGTKLAQMATYQTYTNPSKVYFTALATDGSTTLVARTQVGVVLIAGSSQLYGYLMPTTNNLTDFIAVWDEGDASDTTIAWESVGVGSGAPPPPPPPPSGNANAQWTASVATSSLLHLNATASVADTYAWELDTVPMPETTSILDYGPLLVGTHHVKLTVTAASDNSTNIKEADVDVAWVGEPITDAQNDAINGFQAPGVGLGQWSPLPIIGPWRNKNVLNEAAGGDNIARIVNVGDGSMKLLMTTQDVINGVSGGYRAEMAMTSAYNAVGAGYPAAVADINHAGNVTVGGSTGPKRFFRMEYLIPSHNADASLTPTGNALQNSINNFTELRGSTSIASTLRATIIAGGPLMAIGFVPVISGAASTEVYFDSHAVALDTWQNYVFEYILSTDSGVGYVRVYRDGVVKAGPAGTDGTGKYFAATAQTDGSGTVIPVAWCLEVYRNHNYLVANPSTPDQTIQYRNCRSGPSMASVA